MDFVVGFMREALSNRVVVVKKSKPAWQFGLLNGVGGKVDHLVIEDAGTILERSRLETPLEAMVREFKEETGIETTQDEWHLVLYMQDPRDFYTETSGAAVNIEPGTVYWFACTRRFLPKLPARVLDSGAEELLTINIHEVLHRNDCVATLRWVIPMAFLDPTLNLIGSDDHVLKRTQIVSGAAPAVAPFNPSPVNPYVWSRHSGPYNGIAVGDIVINKFGTERGVVHAFGDDGKVAWVNSTDHAAKWVTMYVESLTLIGVSGCTGPVGPGPGTGVSSKLDRDGVVSDGSKARSPWVCRCGQYRLKDCDCVGRVPVDTTGQGLTKPPSWYAHAQETAAGAAGHVTGVPHEPAASPDAEWLNNGAGAQEDFGGRRQTTFGVR